MSGMSNWLENKVLLDYIGAGKPVYVGFNTADPQDGFVPTEPSGGAYARILGTDKFTITDASATNNQELTSAEATASWGTLTFVSLWSALTGGNLLWSGPLFEAKPIGAGDVVRFKVGQLTIVHD